MNRSNNPGDKPESPAATPQESTSPAARPRRRPPARAKAETDAATEPAAAAPSEQPPEQIATPAEEPKAAPARRGRAAAPAAAAEAAPQPEVEAAPQPEVEATPAAPAEESTGAPPARSRSRGRRGSGSSRAAAEARQADGPAAEAAPLPEAEAAPVTSADEAPAGPPARSRSRGRRGGGGRIAPESRPVDSIPAGGRPALEPRRQPAEPRRPSGGPAGSAESLIARQNVLFEEFARQQAETLREVTRSLKGAGTGLSTGTSLTLPKVGVFLDVPNLIYAAEQIGVRVHFGKLLDYLTDGRQLVRATAYAPITDDPQTRFEAQRFVLPVNNQGYKIVTKPWKRFSDGSMKANFDIELAVDILTMSDRLDIVALLSGDGDFRRVCELVESRGVRVEVVAFSQSTAMELRAVADSYIDLSTILNLVGA